jgi:MFS family permease
VTTDISPALAATATSETRAPPSAWVALWVFVVVSIFGFVDRQVLSLLAEPMKQALHLSDTQIGLLQGLGFALFSTFLVYPLGVMADRYDRRLILSLCVILWSIATAACGLGHSFFELLLATIGIAVGETALVPIQYSVLPDLFPFRQRVMANNIVYLASFLGIAAGLMFGGVAIAALESLRSTLPPWLRSWDSWRLVFFAVALPGPIFVVLISLLKLPRAVHPDVASDGTLPSAFITYLRAHLKTVVLIFGAISMYVFAYGAVFNWLAIMLIRNYGFSPSSSGIALGGELAAQTVIGLLIASLAMRIIVPHLGKLATLRVSRVAMLIAFVPTPFLLLANSASLIFGLVLISGAGGVVAGCLSPNLFQDISPPHLRARIAAFSGIIIGLIGGAGGMLVGYVSDLLHGNPQSLILAMVLVGSPGWLLAWWLMQLAEAPFRRTLSELSATEAVAV